MKVQHPGFGVLTESGPRQGNSGGFTLIELLAVMAIIALLAALTVGGIFRWVDSRRSSNSEAAVRIVDKVLSQHWKFVIDKAKKEDIPAGVLSMAGGNASRARVIWVNLRLKQEFPMNYEEAYNPHLPSNPYVTAATLPGKRVYYLALKDTYPPPPSPPAPPLPPPDPAQNASCLLLSLKQNRGGVTLPDDMGPSIGDSNGDGIHELVDGWGKPMVFFRFPTGSAELDAANPATAGTRAAKFRNPLDPDGLLLDGNWNNAGTFGLGQGVYWFEQLCHPVHEGNYNPRAVYMVPTIVSGGANMVLGLNSDMSIAGAAADSDDNIYSFKLR